jgi:hypothetical protein
MKNPIRFSNKNKQKLFIYHYYDNSMFQLCELSQNETTILNIPFYSHIAIKTGYDNGNYIIPAETIMETYIDKNYFIF